MSRCLASLCSQKLRFVDYRTRPKTKKRYCHTHSRTQTFTTDHTQRVRMATNSPAADDPEDWSGAEDDEPMASPQPIVFAPQFTAMAVVTPVFTCTFAACQRIFPTRARFLDHFRAVHCAKRYSCPACVMKFTYKCDVKRHYLRMHKGASPLTWGGTKPKVKGRGSAAGSITAATREDGE